MTRLLSGVRGRVTFTVLAVTAILYSLLGTIGFLLIANSGREAIRTRVDEVLSQLETSVRDGRGTTSIATNDGVYAFAISTETTPEATPGVLQVTRAIEVQGVDVFLVGRTSEARLADNLRSLHRGLWVAIPIAAIVSALMAGAATRRALRPVGSITALADSVSGSPNGVRVPVPDTDDEIAHLATTLNAMLDRIDASQLAQQQFTSDAAHELRTPLMALQGELELLANGTQQLDQPLLERLASLSTRLGARIDDLVLLSTLDEHRPLALGDIDLSALVVSEASVIMPGMEIVGTAPTFRADPALVSRAVRNLLANAKRHSRSRVRATIVHSGDRVILYVDDDGPGLPEDAAERVFGRFSRLEEARDSSTGGAGLGLAIVAAVARAHGGSVNVTRSDIGGARFELSLPLSA